MKIVIRWIDIGKNSLPEINELSDYRREKLNNQSTYLHIRNMACEYLLRETLREQGLFSEGKLSIACSPHGKPYLCDIPVHFNISHSEDIVACAVSQCQVGLDVQKLSGFNQKLANRYFSPDEIERINKEEDKNGMFTRIWAAKESFIKALGVTLSHSLWEAALSFENENNISCRGYRIYSRIISDYSFCCCPLTEEECEIEIKEMLK